jgi:anti-sigma B factor antagonist
MSAHTVSVREVEGVSVVEFQGRLTMGEAVEDFIEAVRKSVEAGRARVVIDLGNVVYIDSSGMGGLMGAASRARAAGGRLKLCSVPEKVMRLFEAGNLQRAFEIYPHEAAALASFRATSA